METLQQWLAQQRKQKNLTEKQLAQILNKPILYIQDIEQGRYILGILEFLKYCWALNIDPNLGIEVIKNELRKQS